MEVSQSCHGNNSTVISIKAIIYGDLSIKMNHSFDIAQDIKLKHKGSIT